MADTEQVLDPAEETPQIDLAKELQEVKGAIGQLLEQSKITQGQARRAEQQAMAAWSAAQPATKTSDTDPVESIISRLDDNDPATRAIKTVFQTQQQTIKQLMQKQQEVDGFRTRQVMTEKEAYERSHAAEELIEKAQHDLGLDVRDPAVQEVFAQINTLPTANMWPEGKKILREFKRSRVVEPTPETKYTETRRAPGARPRTYVEMEQAYGDGDISSEDWSAYQKAHPR